MPERLNSRLEISYFRPCLLARVVLIRAATGTSHGYKTGPTPELACNGTGHTSRELKVMDVILGVKEYVMGSDKGCQVACPQDFGAQASFDMRNGKSLQSLLKSMTSPRSGPGPHRRARHPPKPPRRRRRLYAPPRGVCGGTWTAPAAMTRQIGHKPRKQ
jgi:hypothetical protein